MTNRLTPNKGVEKPFVLENPFVLFKIEKSRAIPPFLHSTSFLSTFLLQRRSHTLSCLLSQRKQSVQTQVVLPQSNFELCCSHSIKSPSSLV